MKKLEGFREVIKNTKRRKPTQIFCPRCCSPNIELSSSLAVWLTPKEYHCPDCGYTGIIVMELEKDEDNKEDIVQETDGNSDSEIKETDKDKENEETKA